MGTGGVDKGERVGGPADERGEAAATASQAQEIDAFRRLSRLLDTQFSLPGIPFRFGLDGLIGLIPGIGDTVTGAMGLYALGVAHRLDLPLGARLKMVWNIAVDVVIGAIPLVGDLFDFAFHAHSRNRRIIEKHLDRRARR